MRRLVLLREAAVTAWANKVPTILIACLLMLMVASTLATVGRTAAAEGQLAARIDAAGSRLLTVRDTKQRGLLNPPVIAQTAALSVSDRTVGSTAAIDVVAGSVGLGGERVPAWGIVGDLAGVAELTAGRWPRPGEALVSETAMAKLGLTVPYGWVQEAASQNPAEFAVVGSFSAREPFDEFDTGLIYNAGTADANVLWVVLGDAREAQAAQLAVLGIIRPTDPTDLNITSPVGLAELRGQVLGDFGGFGRALLLGILTAGSALIAIVVLADVLVRRADLGRRRALGATRGTILAIVALRTFIAAVPGAVMGIVAGYLLNQASQYMPPVSFVTGVTVLAVLAAIAAAIPPALFAATRDPVAELRTP